MEEWLGIAVPAYAGLLALFGLPAFLTGQAAARQWRGPAQALGYAALLALAARFLIYALFEGRLVSATGFATDLAFLAAVALVAHRVTHVRCVLAQYPWLYERAGPFGYRARGAIGGGPDPT
ncbi:membrane protein [Sulfurifustis variabilis]|uniref:Membrane protein n=1 Tax=Sulfurifustis variabilis TaxID=1675686 RepID=A0A1B4V0V8_9GAMM|nr:hypothetical protein [Sulfurifustis variabilis]BAU46855.1 membrane protein [Sulfurifustis variabilis]